MFAANLSFLVISVDIGKWLIFWYSYKFSKNWYLLAWLLMLPSQHTEKLLPSVIFMWFLSNVAFINLVSLFIILKYIYS